MDVKKDKEQFMLIRLVVMIVVIGFIISNVKAVKTTSLTTTISSSSSSSDVLRTSPIPFQASMPPNHVRPQDDIPRFILYLNLFCFRICMDKIQVTALFLPCYSYCMCGQNQFRLQRMHISLMYMENEKNATIVFL